MQTLNQALYRELRSDYPQDIFPKVACKRTELGDGDTFFSVQQIVTTINNYFYQCEKIAKLLKGKSLSISCRNVHQFLYSHFQYHADSDVQQLRSPSCSWAQRFTGIDCKSYTILAGAILKAMGYNSFVRQIKQPYSLYPDDFSHVYLVVPISQEDKDLNKGYYVIDGTIPTMQETPFSEKSDVIVMDMKHIGLNGTQNTLFGFAPKKGLRATDDGKTYKGYEGSKTENIVKDGNKVIGDLFNVAGTVKDGIDKLTGKGNNRPNPANLPPTANSNTYDRQQSNNAREIEEIRNRNYNNSNHSQITPVPNTPSTPDKPKDNTVIYVVVGGVVILGSIVAFTVMNKKNK